MTELQYGVAWRLRIDRFDRIQPGYFVGLGARRTDFDLYRLDTDGRPNYVFDPLADATAAGTAAFVELGRPIDVLLPKGGGVGDIVLAGSINLHVLAKRADTPEKWQKFLWKFKSWLKESNPKEAVRKRYIVHMEKDSNGLWTIVSKEENRWL
jgi:hypothetical protein